MDAANSKDDKKDSTSTVDSDKTDSDAIKKKIEAIKANMKNNDSSSSKTDSSSDLDSSNSKTNSDSDTDSKEK